MLYALKIMTFHLGEQKRKEKFLYREDSDIIITIDEPRTPPTPTTDPDADARIAKRCCRSFFSCW